MRQEEAWAQLVAALDTQPQYDVTYTACGTVRAPDNLSAMHLFRAAITNGPAGSARITQVTVTAQHADR